MAEVIDRIEWPLGSRMVFAWGRPDRPLGSTGLRDPFVVPVTTASYINEDGVVSVRIFAAEPVFDEDDAPETAPVLDSTPCSYLAESNGVHFYVSDVPAAYDFVLGRLPVVVLDADAAVLLGTGNGRRILRFKIV